MPENLSGASVSELEERFLAETFRRGREALSKFLSELLETRPVCPDCGRAMRNLGPRKKSIVTLLGTLEYERNYYVCDNCKSHAIPKDERLEVKGSKFTPGVKRVAAKMASSESFAAASDGLREYCRIEVSAKECERIAEKAGEVFMERKEEEIEFARQGLSQPRLAKPIGRLYIECDGTGVPICKVELAGRKGKQADGGAKTREMKTGCIFRQRGVDDKGQPLRDTESMSYFARIGTAEEFGWQLYSEAVKRGLEQAEDVVVIGDGAKWIWNLVEEHFPGVRQIIDIYHAKEHIFELIQALVDEPSEQRSRKEEFYALLEAGDIEGLLGGLEALNPRSEEQKKKLRTESAYFRDNQKRMRYNEFRDMGLFVGSGVIEAACKEVVGRRLKRAGMHWSVKGANKIAALRCAVKSKEFDLYLKEAA